MTFNEFLDIVDETYGSNDEMRYGQSVMNVLWNIWPDKYKEIVKTDLDCFYDDGTTRLTLEHLDKEWHKYGQI